MLNYNQILLLGAKVLDIDLNKYNLQGSAQQIRFTSGVKIKENTAIELAKALEKQLLRDIGSKRAVKAIKHIIEMYLTLCKSIKNEIDLKSDKQIKKWT